MATYPKILSTNEIKEFDIPPVFSNEDREIYFGIPTFIEEDLSEIRNDLNKLVLILLGGYFKCRRKFFIPATFHKKDISYVIKKFNLNIKEPTMEKFNRTTLFRYKELILKNFAVFPFDEKAKQLLIQEAKLIVQKKFKMKAIFQGILEFLYLKRIEVPTYNSLAEIITEVLNDYEKNLEEKLSELLDDTKKELLDKLLQEIESEANENKNSKRYKITKLKKFSHSTKPFKIKENNDSLKFFKNIFENLKEVTASIKLSPETVEYYAIWTINADVAQIKIKPENKRYLYLISFVIHQYYFLQDLLIDILLSAIQNTSNTAKRENTDNYYNEKKEREKKIFNISEAYERDIYPIFVEIEKIMYSKILSSEQKVESSIKILSSTKKNRAEIKENFQEIKKESKRNLKDNDLFDVFHKKSVKLQNRVSEIVKTIDFDRTSSSKKIMEAIDYYRLKNGNIDHNAPDSFIDDDKKTDALYDNNNKFRVSLYKVFLFQEISGAMKSGRLNIKYSYRYKSINEYLINKDFWKNNRQELLERAGLLEFKNFDITIEKLKKALEKQYKETNRNILKGKNSHITFKNDRSYTLSTPKTGYEDSPSVSDLFTGHENIALTEILFDVNKITSFLEPFEHHNLKHTREKPKDNVFFAGITGYGCNIGKNKIAKISKGINEHELSNTLKWYFNIDNIHSANNRILSFVEHLDLPNVFRQSKNINHTSSDGQKYALEGDSITGNYSYKYFGKGRGVSVYTFIDQRHFLFYSTVISSSEREAGYVIDGLMSNDIVKSDIHSTDSHGYTEMIFAITHLLGYSFAPRIKGFKEKNLYCFDSATKKEFEEKGYKILPNSKNYINLKVLKENWDDILRFISTIKLRETTASQLLTRLSSYSKKNRLYQALNEFGKIISTVFLLKYIDDVKLRQAIEKQLNKVESSNKFAKAVFFGNNQEFEYVTKEEQEIAEGCKRLIENSIICWNYLYLSQKLTDTKEKIQQDNMIEIIKNGSIVFWKHINLLGEYNFSEDIFDKKLKFDIPKILDLNVA
jgi:TnpA family transposase